MRRRSVARKLAGWGILAVAALLIVGIFVVSRLGHPAGPGASVATASPASSAAPASESAPVVSQPPASSEPAPVSPASSAASSAPPQADPGVRVIDPQAMDQASRKALLSTLIDQGIFTGIEAVSSPPKVGVTPLFLGLNASLQQQFIALVYAYVNNGAASTVPLQVIDATNGKTLENFTVAEGLKQL